MSGVAFGIDLSLETTDSQAVDATNLDVPGTNGTRAPVDFPEWPPTGCRDGRSSTC